MKIKESSLSQAPKITMAEKNKGGQGSRNFYG